MPRPKTDQTRRTLRLPPELDVRVKAAASDNSRSMNAEIIQRLRASFKAKSTR